MRVAARAPKSAPITQCPRISTSCRPTRLQIYGHRKKIVQKSYCKAAEQPTRHNLPDRQTTHDDLQETAAYL
jgi:hypothetical protein